MKRILVLSESDWLDPYAGAVAHYLRHLLERMANQGHYAALVAHQCVRRPSWTPWWPLTPKRPTIEITDGVQIARMGARALYPFMMRLLLSRLAKAGKLDSQYNIILYAATGELLDFAPYTSLPVLPVVFHFRGKKRPKKRPDGPLVAATREAEAQLLRAGFTTSQIIRAPFGAEIMENHEAAADKPAIALALQRPGLFLRALTKLENAERPLTASFLTNAPMERRIRRFRSIRITAFPQIPGDSGTSGFDAACRTASFGVCGPGREYEAMRFAGLGRPVLCPDTPDAREYMIPDETGLLYPPRDANALASLMRRLLDDEVLYKRLCTGARRFSVERTWDQTAGIIQGAIENAT